MRICQDDGTSTRFIEFTTPEGNVNSVSVERLFLDLFAVLAPAGHVLPNEPATERWPYRTQLTSDGNGLTVDSQQGGAVFGELVEDTYRLRVGEISFATSVVGHATQTTLVIQILATDAIDVATDALLECAAQAGLVFVRRGES